MTLVNPTLATPKQILKKCTTVDSTCRAGRYLGMSWRLMSWKCWAFRTCSYLLMFSADDEVTCFRVKCHSTVIIGETYLEHQNEQNDPEFEREPKLLPTRWQWGRCSTYKLAMIPPVHKSGKEAVQFLNVLDVVCSLFWTFSQTGHVAVRIGNPQWLVKYPVRTLGLRIGPRNRCIELNDNGSYCCTLFPPQNHQILLGYLPALRSL